MRENDNVALIASRSFEIYAVIDMQSGRLDSDFFDRDTLTVLPFEIMAIRVSVSLLCAREAMIVLIVCARRAHEYMCFCCN